jgi:hypothetical protein
LIVALLATLGATVVAFVLYPVFAEARAGGLAGLGAAEREILDLEEKKSRLYAALADLDSRRRREGLGGRLPDGGNDYRLEARASKSSRWPRRRVP